MLLVAWPSIAQNQDRNNATNRRDTSDREELIAKRNTFLVEKMSLTAEETAVFIPLENELLRKKFEVGRECFRYGRELDKKEEKTEEEIKKLLNCREEVKEKREKLDKEYLEKFKKVLSAEKILLYQNADKTYFDEFIRNRR
jgi:hypothetical protein